MAAAPDETLPGQGFPTGAELTRLSDAVPVVSDVELVAALPASLATELRAAAQRGEKRLTTTLLSGISIEQIKALRNTQQIQVTTAGPNTYTFSWL